MRQIKFIEDLHNLKEKEKAEARKMKKQSAKYNYEFSRFSNGKGTDRDSN